MEVWGAIPGIHIHQLGLRDKRRLDCHSVCINCALPKDKFICLQSHFSLAPFCVARLVRLPLSWRAALAGVIANLCASAFPFSFFPFFSCFRPSTVHCQPLVCLYFVTSLLLSFLYVQ